jgi:TonB family protein
VRDRASEWLDAEALGRSAFRRFVVASAIAHLLLLALLVWTPRSSSQATLPGVVTVDLVAMAAPAAAAKPAAPAPVRPAPPPPAPEQPKPAPEAPKPVPIPPKAEVVLPKNPQREPEKPKPKAAPEPKPEPEPPKPVARPKPEPAKPDYDDVLASLRAERGETRPERVDRSAPTAPASGSPQAAPLTPEVAGWLRAARMAVRQAWVLPAGFRKEPLETHVTVDLDAQGRVLSEPRVTQRSGNPWYDESVVRAIQKASPLPAPPEPGAWSFVFRPEDLG